MFLLWLVDGETLKLSLEKNFREYGNSKKLYEKCSVWSFSSWDKWFIVPIDFFNVYLNIYLHFLTPFLPWHFCCCCCYFIFTYFFLGSVMQDFNSPTRDQSHAPCNGNMESQPLNCQENPLSVFCGTLQGSRIQQCLPWRHSRADESEAGHTCGVGVRVIDGA